MKKKVNAKDLVSQIAEITRERIRRSGVIDISSVRKLTAKTPTILVVEDDESLLKIFRRLFESKGYNVIAASSGAQLSDVFTESYVDLIILDIGLPWIDGFELAEMMKSHKELKEVPLVFVSGQNDMESKKRGFAVGAHDYITKPFDVQKISKTIETLLRLNS